MENKKVPVLESIDFSINAFKRSWALFLFVFLVFIPVSLFFNIYITKLLNSLINLFSNKVSAANSAINNSIHTSINTIDNSIDKTYGFLYAAILNRIVQFYNTSIIIRLAYNIYQGHENNYLKLFLPSFRVIKYIIVMLLINGLVGLVTVGSLYLAIQTSIFTLLIISIGFALSIFIEVYLGFAGQNILYKNYSIIKAFSSSLNLVKSIEWPLFWFYIFALMPSALINRIFSGSIAANILSLLVNAVFLVAQAYIYLDLLEQESVPIDTRDNNNNNTTDNEFHDNLDNNIDNSD